MTKQQAINLLAFLAAIVGCSALCADNCDAGCTLTQGYWKNHWQAWPQGWENATLCGIDNDCGCPETTLRALFAQSVQGYKWLALAHQYAAGIKHVCANGCQHCSIGPLVLVPVIA
jgi:hypothetical protein